MPIFTLAHITQGKNQYCSSLSYFKVVRPIGTAGVLHKKIIKFHEPDGSEFQNEKKKV